MEELEKATNNFSRDCLVGSGAFGNVYRGIFDKEGTLAIKKANAESYTSTGEFKNGKSKFDYVFFAQAIRCSSSISSVTD